MPEYKIKRGEEPLCPKKRFLLRQFAQFETPMKARLAYYDKFGEEPTDIQIQMADIGAFMHGKENTFVQRSNRMKYFKTVRNVYLRKLKADSPLGRPEIRMWRLGQLFEISLEKAKKTGDTSRCIQVLEAAAKESAKYYEKGNTTTINVDARSIGAMSSDEIDKRINSLLSAFGSHMSAAQSAAPQQIEAAPEPDEGEENTESEEEAFDYAELD
jgi:ribosomal protein L12E/L44/L45/RPP1/RPP2